MDILKYLFVSILYCKYFFWLLEHLEYSHNVYFNVPAYQFYSVFILHHCQLIEFSPQYLLYFPAAFKNLIFYWILHLWILFFWVLAIFIFLKYSGALYWGVRLCSNNPFCLFVFVWLFLLRLVWLERTVFNIKFLHYGGITTMSILPNAHSILQGFPHWLVKAGTINGAMWARGIVPLNSSSCFCCCFSLSLGHFSYMYVLISIQLSPRREFFTDLWCFCQALSSPVLCPINSCCLIFPELLTSSPQCREI